MKRKGRVWTDEQRAVASKRMAEVQAAKKVLHIEIGKESPVSVKERPPEVQAVIDSMTPERRAKLDMIQARTLANVVGTQDQRAVAEALARHEAEKATGTSEAPFGVGPVIEGGDPNPPSRIGSREVSLIVRTDGTMVSQYGPCLCGMGKRQWHPICLKEAGNGH